MLSGPLAFPSLFCPPPPRLAMSCRLEGGREGWAAGRVPHTSVASRTPTQFLARLPCGHIARGGGGEARAAS